jgi:transglutaminase-like putative cysteine protease
MPQRVRFRSGKTAPEYLLERRRSPRKRPQRLVVEFARLTTGRCRSFRHQLQLTPL